MSLRVLSRYRSGERNYEAGQVIDVTEEEAAFLQRDSPGSFELATGAPLGIADAPNRMAKGGRQR